MTVSIYALSGVDGDGTNFASALGAFCGVLGSRHFPDGETYVRFVTDPQGQDVILLGSLDRPDGKILKLLFAAATARELGARSVGLVAPYLAYMRQDRRFRPGEALTSAQFAKVLSREIDWLVTIDPHLHRWHDLSDIYSKPALALQAAPLLSDWIRREVPRPVLIGPDVESEQWVGAVARDADAPYVILEKIRHGDKDVAVSIPDIDQGADRTPVIVDDIVSTARTMIETVRHVSRTDRPRPICLAVHGVFADDAHADLLAAGAARVVTSNTIPHESNAIDVTDLLCEGVQRLMHGRLSAGSGRGR